MVWMPWQSVHTGACSLPRAIACPWMLCINGLICAWHLPQVCGTLNLLISDFASLAGRMSCAPWQSVHTAALCQPFSTARPCTLSW